MNAESNAQKSRTPSAKSTSYKRMHRANRPVLLTPEAHEPAETAPVEVQPSVVQVAVEERPEIAQAPRKRMPTFFTSIGKESKGTPEADPKAARLARALRGKTTERVPEEASVVKKSTVPPSKASVALKRPPSRFKMRYLWGMMLYVLIAEYLGAFLTSYMNANHLNATIFQWHAPWGLFVFDRATLFFLGALIIILIIMARFDLIPRSLGAMAGTPPAGGRSASTQKAEPTFTSKVSQPTVKQGVQGADDDLYQEYRANQRYYQRRDRKR